MASEVIATIRSERYVRYCNAMEQYNSLTADMNANRANIVRINNELWLRRDPLLSAHEKCDIYTRAQAPLNAEYEELGIKLNIVVEGINTDQKRTEDEVLEIQKREVAFRSIAEEVAFKAKQREVKRITEEAKRRKVEMWKFRMICAFLGAATALIVHYCLEYQHNDSASITTT